MGQIPGLPPRRQRSEAEDAERAMHALEERLARDADRAARHRRLIIAWMLIHAGAFAGMHALMSWANGIGYAWVIGSAAIGAGASWCWWRTGDGRGAVLLGLAGIGWMLAAWGLGWTDPFASVLSLFITPVVAVAHVVGAVFSSAVMRLGDQETM